MSDSPAVIPYSDAGDPLATNAGTPATKALTVQGNSAGTPLPVSGSVSVTNLPATQPVSATALPLPTGASTAAKQDTTNTSLANIDGKLPALAAGRVPVDIGSTTQNVADGGGSLTIDSTQLPAALDGGGNLKVAVQGTPAVTVSGTPAVTVSSGAISATISNTAATMPLATGASTAALQTTANTSLGSIDTKTPALVSGRVPVDGSGVTQPVSGTVAISGTPNVAVTSSALPTGAALDATLTSGAQKAINRGGAKGTTTAADVTSTASGANHQALDVVIYDVSGNPITSFGSSSVSVSNFPATQAVSAASLPLPSGAATAAKQPALGTAGTASTDVLTVQGIASMTALKVDGSAVTQPVSGSVSVSNFPATQTVSGTVTVSGVAQDATLTGGNQKAIIRGGAKGTTVAADVTSRAAGANSQPLEVAIVDASGNQITNFGGSGGSVTVSNFPATQAISAASLPLPTGAATDAKLDTAISKLSSIDVKLTAPLDTNVTNGSLNVASPQDVVTTGTITAISQTVTTPDLNGQGTGMFILTGTWAGSLQFEGSVDGTNFVAVAARAVNATNTIITIGSNGTWRFNCGGFKRFQIRAVSFTSGTANITIRTSAAVTGVVLTEPLPNGTNTIGAVNQGGTWTITQGNSAAASGRWPVQLTDGTTLTTVKAASIAAVATDPALVVAVSPNNTVAVSAASLPLPSGAATETTLSALNSKMPVQGQAVMASSQPVVIASNQSAIPVTSSTLALDATFTGGSGRIKVTDGTNNAAVKITPAIVADPALVVSLSPNTRGANPSAAFAAVVTTTSSTVLAANASRIGCSVQNGGTTTVYLHLHSTAATLGRFTVAIAPNDYYEFPSYEGVGCYRGDVQAISATGSPGLIIQEVI